MDVQQFFDRLADGEIRSLSVVDEATRAIDPAEYRRVIQITNSALQSLHTRFALRRAYATIETIAGTKTYQVAPDPAQGGALVKIVEVCRTDDPATPEDERQVYRLNGRNTPMGVEVALYDTLRFDKPKDGEFFQVTYQAGHPPLLVPVDAVEATEEDPAIPASGFDQEIHLPPHLEEALVLRVAADLFNAMNGEGHKETARELRSRYDELCSEAKLDDAAQETETDDYDRLRDKGFI